MLECKVTQQGDQAVLVLEGDITVQNIASLKDVLLTSLTGSASVAVDVGRVTRSDLSFLQLLCAAHRQARALGKPLTFQGCTSEQFQVLAAESGYARDHHCDQGAPCGCFWNTGERA